MEKGKNNCDTITGVCAPKDLGESVNGSSHSEKKEIIYVGDPMCSWCWGISNELQKLKKHFSHYEFTVIVGGLRPGGGDVWNDKFIGFLKHHWLEVNKRSGQPFGYSLFEKSEFNYDTEPPCRAVVTAKKWLKDNLFDFYEAVPRKFYVDNEDPNELSFYESICKQFKIPFKLFQADFLSETLKYTTNQEFMLNRQWGVKAYPTVLFKSNKELYQINRGYETFENMKLVIEKILKEEVIQAK